MANEAVLRYNESFAGPVIQDYDLSGSQSFEKGTLMALRDEREVSGSAVLGEPMAGIMGRETIVGDGRVRAAVHKKGYFDVKASGAIAIGDRVQSAGHGNFVRALTGTAWSGSSDMGYSEAAGADNETFLMRLDL